MISAVITEMYLHLMANSSYFSEKNPELHKVNDYNMSTITYSTKDM